MRSQRGASRRRGRSGRGGGGGRGGRWRGGSGGGPARAELYAYFCLPGPPDTAQLAAWAATLEPELGFAHYLLGLQRQVQGAWSESAAELDRALALGLPDVLFVRNAARRLAVAGY